MAKTVTFSIPHDNYLDYMRRRGLFRGSHNARKVCILIALFHRYEQKPVSSYDLWQTAGRDVSYGCIRATVSRMVKHGYLSHTQKGYNILSKGIRFLYASSELAPGYNAWYDSVMQG